MNVDEREKQAMRAAVCSGDAEALRKLLADSEKLRAMVNAPMFDFGGRAINAASQHLEAMDVLLEFGADINLRSDWDKGPFGVLDSCPEELARPLMARGAILTAHAAARLGWLKELREIVTANPAVVHEKGGDGQRPLHFAKTVEIVDFLLDNGAEIDALCDDHSSTAAQYALKERPEVTRRLLQRGTRPDIFMAARLGDAALAERCIAEDARCLAVRTFLGGYGWLPVMGIYNWVLGFYLSPMDVSLAFGHRDLFDLLIRRSTVKGRFLDAAMRGDEAAAQAALAQQPGLREAMTAADHALAAYAALQGREAAVRTMLDLGFDPLARGLDGGTILHMAAWIGHVGIIREMLKRGVDLETLDPTYHGTALVWAAYGSVHRRCETGDYAGAIRTLVAGGAKMGPKLLGLAEGNEEIQAVLRGLGAA